VLSVAVVVLNDTVITEYQIGKNMEEISDPIWSTLMKFDWCNWVKAMKKLRIVGVMAKVWNEVELITA
jgi:hypothetical protein